jgi:hypothetical protein
MENDLLRWVLKRTSESAILLFASLLTPQILSAQTPTTPAVPDWAQPGSATHMQIPPPAQFHRPTTTFATPIGIFDGQSDIGSAIVPGSASYDPASNQYTIHSAGYNIWYTRDEFRYLWKKISGDVSLAAGVSFPDPNGYNDRKVVLVIRQNLNDDSKEAMIGEHGTGMVHLAQRPAKGVMIVDMQYRFGGGLNGVLPSRIGIEKHGDSIAIFVSLKSEPMHQFGPPIQIHFDEPFYVGVGFCSHLPATSDAAVLSDVELVNSAGQVR